MPPLSRLRQPTLARLLMLCVLLFGVLAQPVMAAVGDVHALGHGSTHAHSETHDDDEGGDRNDGGLLHALMHAGHCGGHTSAIAVPMIEWPSQVQHAAASARIPGIHASHRGDMPLRPPTAI